MIITILALTALTVGMICHSICDHTVWDEKKHPVLAHLWMSAAFEGFTVITLVLGILTSGIVAFDIVGSNVSADGLYAQNQAWYETLDAKVDRGVCDYATCLIDEVSAYNQARLTSKLQSQSSWINWLSPDTFRDLPSIDIHQVTNMEHNHP